VSLHGPQQIRIILIITWALHQHICTDGFRTSMSGQQSIHRNSLSRHQRSKRAPCWISWHRVNICNIVCWNANIQQGIIGWNQIHSIRRDHSVHTSWLHRRDRSIEISHEFTKRQTAQWSSDIEGGSKRITKMPIQHIHVIPRQHLNVDGIGRHDLHRQQHQTRISVRWFVGFTAGFAAPGKHGPIGSDAEINR